MTESQTIAYYPNRGVEQPAIAHSLPEPYGVLIVDDEEIIRNILALFMRKRGIPTWLVSDGNEAVEIYREHADEIGMVLLDVRMHGMDGPTTFLKLKELNPALVGYFMSGNWDPYTEEMLLDLGAVALLAKPFRLSQIDEIVKMHLLINS
jgi:CheY-like chemotaxis protein